MNLGKCSKCGNKSELHEGMDGRAYCEDCLARNPLIDPVHKVNRGVEGGVFAEPTKDKRGVYIEWIATHATDDWIDRFLDEWRLEMKRSMGWVDELGRVDNEIKLLRMAAELGYGKKERPLDRDNREGNSKGSVKGTSSKVKATTGS